MNSTVASHATIEAPDVIETPRLHLVRWSDAHFEDFARFLCDPDVIRYIRAEPLTREKGIEHHAQSLDEWQQHGFGKRAVHEIATGAWIGFVELSLVGPGKGCREDDVEIGYFVTPAKWGHGIATEAATAIRDEAFARVGVSELLGRSRVENTASARVMEKIGFRRTRTHVLAEGVTVAIHRLGRTEWMRHRHAAEQPRPVALVVHSPHEPRSGYRETG